MSLSYTAKTNVVFDASDAIRQQLKVNGCLQSYLFQMIRYLAVQLRKSIFYSHFRHFANLMVLLRGSNNSCSAVKHLTVTLQLRAFLQ